MTTQLGVYGVFGIATTALYPPSAAARAPDATVSARSPPGRRQEVPRERHP